VSRSVLFIHRAGLCRSAVRVGFATHFVDEIGLVCEETDHRRRARWGRSVGRSRLLKHAHPVVDREALDDPLGDAQPLCGRERPNCGQQLVYL
jgi:hypothetical protein